MKQAITLEIFLLESFWIAANHPYSKATAATPTTSTRMSAKHSAPPVGSVLEIAEGSLRLVGEMTGFLPLVHVRLQMEFPRKEGSALRHHYAIRKKQ